MRAASTTPKRAMPPGRRSSRRGAALLRYPGGHAGARVGPGAGLFRSARGLRCPLSGPQPEDRLQPGGNAQPRDQGGLRSEEHTSELQSLMRISYAVFCLKKKKTRAKDIYT